MAGAKILIVEDNPTNLKLAKLLLTIEHHEVYTATNAEEMLKVLTSTHPDLILMDVQLPGKNGLVLTQELKANPKLKDIPVVALTAYAMKGDEEKARNAGCDGFIPKPISAATFSIEIAKYLQTTPNIGQKE